MQKKQMERDIRETNEYSSYRENDCRTTSELFLTVVKKKQLHALEEALQLDQTCIRVMLGTNLASRL